MLFTKKKKTQAGFTLVEILVVLVIIIVLAVLVISGYSEGRPRLAVERTAESFASDLYRAKQRALSGMIYEDGDDFFEGGHGIKINENDDFYTFYAGESNQKEIEVITLENLAKIKSVNPENGNELNIFFSDDGDVTFNGSGGIATVVFTAKDDDSITREVEINSSGVVKIKYE